MCFRFRTQLQLLHIDEDTQLIFACWSLINQIGQMRPCINPFPSTLWLAAMTCLQLETQKPHVDCWIEYILPYDTSYHLLGRGALDHFIAVRCNPLHALLLSIRIPKSHCIVQNLDSVIRVEALQLMLKVKVASILQIGAFVLVMTTHHGVYVPEVDLEANPSCISDVHTMA